MSKQEFSALKEYLKESGNLGEYWRLGVGIMSIIGIIAEDKCDVDVIAELVSKIVPGKRFSTKHFLGHGCGKIKGKCFIWAQVLKNRVVQLLSCCRI